MNVCKSGMLRWVVNTNAWNPSRTEWVTAMRLVGNDEERIRINRFVFKKDAKHALIGRLLIRKCCYEFLGADRFSSSTNNQEPNEASSKITISRTEKGKPILLQSIIFPFLFSIDD